MSYKLDSKGLRVPPSVPRDAAVQYVFDWHHYRKTGELIYRPIKRASKGEV